MLERVRPVVYVYAVKRTTAKDISLMRRVCVGHRVSRALLQQQRLFSSNRRIVEGRGV